MAQNQTIQKVFLSAHFKNTMIMLVLIKDEG